MALGAKVYEEAAKSQAQNSSSSEKTSENKDDNIKDAEYEEK